MARSTEFTYLVTVVNPGSGNKYYMNGILQQYITLFPGCTYEFDQSDGTNSTHNLAFATLPDAASSSQYTTGVTTSGTPGNSGAYAKIEVTTSTPTRLFPGIIFETFETISLISFGNVPPLVSHKTTHLAPLS